MTDFPMGCIGNLGKLKVFYLSKKYHEKCYQISEMFLAGLYSTMKIHDGICTLGATAEVSECRGKAK